METISLTIALRRSIMEGVGIQQFRKEWKDLSERDKQDLVDEFNKSKCLGENVEVMAAGEKVNL